jgi:hypothetical protein
MSAHAGCRRSSWAQVADELQQPVASTVGSAIGVGDVALTAWSIVRWPIIVIFMTLAVAVNGCGSLLREIQRQATEIPADEYRGGVAILTWIVASVLFGLYVTNFSSYNKIYGALAGVIVFLLWPWITNLDYSSAPSSTRSWSVYFSSKRASPPSGICSCHHGTLAPWTRTRLRDEQNVERGRELRRSRGRLSGFNPVVRQATLTAKASLVRSLNPAVGTPWVSHRRGGPHRHLGMPLLLPDGCGLAMVTAGSMPCPDADELNTPSQRAPLSVDGHVVRRLNGGGSSAVGFVISAFRRIGRAGPPAGRSPRLNRLVGDDLVVQLLSA